VAAAPEYKTKNREKKLPTDYPYRQPLSSGRQPLLSRRAGGTRRSVLPGVAREAVRDRGGAPLGHCPREQRRDSYASFTGSAQGPAIQVALACTSMSPRRFAERDSALVRCRMSVRGRVAGPAAPIRAWLRTAVADACRAAGGECRRSRRAMASAAESQAPGRPSSARSGSTPIRVEQCPSWLPEHARGHAWDIAPARRAGEVLVVTVGWSQAGPGGLHRLSACPVPWPAVPERPARRRA
jgi:hypothetical protein